MNYIFRAYKILDGVFRNSAFSSIELNKALNIAEDSEKASITKIVYGVLENSVKYDFYLSKLCAKKPKNSVITILKVGMYLLYEMNSVPSYAAINECVMIAKKISKGSLTGFVNATLRSAIDFKPTEFSTIEEEISVNYSAPYFIVKKLINQYGVDKTKEILTRPKDLRTTIRNNGKLISSVAFENQLKAHDEDYERIYDNAFLVKLPSIKDKIPKKYYTAQALASIIAVDALKIKSDGKILDLCSAPGGKAVYASEKAQLVTALDLYPHRVLLIDSYAKRMEAKNVTAKENDGTVLNKEYIDKFDKVICDVPCSGIGVMHNKPDILFGITEEKILGLNHLQYQLLDTSSAYVKKGGVLMYSTCTLLNEENDDIVNKFLFEHENFQVSEIDNVKVPYEKTKFGVQLLPNISKTIGFYIVTMVRK